MTELAHQMDCACTVYKFPKDRGKFRLVYCPLHEAAPLLYDALRMLVSHVPQDQHENLWSDARAALREAIGNGPGEHDDT